MKKNLLLISLGLLPFCSYSADLILHFPMDSDSYGRLTETVSGKKINLRGRHVTDNLPGAAGNALRFDGYSTYATGSINTELPAGSITFTMWVAPETYPIILHDLATPEKAGLAGTIDRNNNKGWGFSLGQHGAYSFDFYANGQLMSVESRDIMPCYEWSYLRAVIDKDSNKALLYRNGVLVGETGSVNVNSLNFDSSTFTIGKSSHTSTTGDFLLDTFNGLIDDICVYAGVETKEIQPENEADLSIDLTRYESDLLRPKYHGMPAANWTNECHGMTYSDGKYHLFFQKNANGPYMSRLHWGHLTSENLYDWTEEKIAIAPGESYDIKGCWSGCVFTDDIITGGMPNVIYTGVDYQKAYMVQAVPTDETLIQWEKKGVIINGKPEGLTDDFRDPYFFRNGNDAYLIVGTSKNGIGATTLHKYNATNGSWSNDGKIFFAGTNTGEHGTFWEMPNVTPMGNGKWLFTCTPQATSRGVHTLYWIGEISSDGTFRPDGTAFSDLELVNGFGYGLLSPTIYQHEGKTILMGIVPDLLPGEENSKLGWAHLYSFPREISLNENGELVQKPLASLENLRNDEGYSKANFKIDGAETIEGIGGRQFEVKGVFKMGDNPFGFNLFKNSNGKASVKYIPSANKLEVDFTKLNRKVNDRNIFDGIYSAVLPEKPAKGSDFTIDVWVDGSIVDIFVNEKWATSIRVYPADNDSNGVEIISEGGEVSVASLEGWLLGDAAYDSEGGTDTPGNNGVDEILNSLPEIVNVCNLNGMILKRNVKSSEALTGLPKGVYIIGNRKVIL